MQDFRKLKEWRIAHEFALEIYKATVAYPFEERFGLVTQLRKASVSLVSNIAEGSSRGSDADFRRFLIISLGSLAEVECQIMLSKDLAMLSAVPYDRLSARIVELRRMLWPLVQRLS
jgi:four helix bundle protein